MKFRNKEQFFSNIGGGDRAPEGANVKENNELNAFLGKGCIYEGKLTFEGRVRIDGRFTGEIFTNDVLEIGQGADVRAEIDVATVIISGEYQGNINARTRVDLKVHARVKGNITSPVLTMEEGAVFDGNLRMDPNAATRPAGARPSSTPTSLPPGTGGLGGPSAGALPERSRTLGLKPVP
ncbi:polymer-forming cytoskeletal protein [Myxococcota bacterium]|nr:polymer-forming cytoskeletal protein [Myxococcota bacterium]